MKKKCFLSIIFIFIFVFVSFSLVHSLSLTVLAEETGIDQIYVPDTESPLTGVCTLPLALASVASGLYIAKRKSR